MDDEPLTGTSQGGGADAAAWPCPRMVSDVPSQCNES
jgi:hypothetical protein